MSLMMKKLNKLKEERIAREQAENMTLGQKVLYGLGGVVTVGIFYVLFCMCAIADQGVM